MADEVISAEEHERVPSPMFMQWPEVILFTTLSKSVIQRRMAAGDFPLPVQLSPNRVAWVRAEVIQWTEARTADCRAGVSEALEAA